MGSSLRLNIRIHTLSGGEHVTGSARASEQTSVFRHDYCGYGSDAFCLTWQFATLTVNCCLSAISHIMFVCLSFVHFSERCSDLPICLGMVGSCDDWLRLMLYVYVFLCCFVLCCVVSWLL